MEQKEKQKRTKPGNAIEAEDRKFFELVAQTIHLNSFSEDRIEILAQILPDHDWSQVREDNQLNAIEPALNERLHRLEQKGLKTIQHFREVDRPLLARAFQLKVYLEFCDDLNELIDSQLEVGASPLKVPFAGRMIAQLESYGLTHQESLLYLGFFYQLRRAYYFISQALVGDSFSMKQLRFALWNNVFTHDVRTYERSLWNRMEDFSTMLLGETGTGKGSAAAAIGRSGFIPFDPTTGRFAHNFNETFIAINLSQFPESLIESELFGHRKGAFTGALDNHEGWFERCSVHGALFLDEIGDLAVPVQIKLLQVLQERTFTPVGSRNLKRFSGRVIAATNHSIDDLRKQNNFRDDFFYRLCSDVITMPTLRQRIEESPAELEQLVNLLVKRTTGRESRELTGMILETLRRDLPPKYPWPGNVRELEQAVRRILLTQHYAGDSIATKLDLEEDLVQKIQAGTLEGRELMSQYCAILYQRFGTYEEVARRTRLDRRTVKKYIEA